MEVISAFFMIPSYFSWIAAQLIALAIILQSVSGLPLIYGVLICASIVLFYTFVGGMWSISITDTIQTVMIVGGLAYLSYYFYDHSGGLSNLKSKMPKDFFRMIPKENNLNAWLLYFSAWITIGWGSIPQQDVFQRVLSAKSENTAVRGSVISAFMYLSVAFLPLSVVNPQRKLWQGRRPKKSPGIIPR